MAVAVGTRERELGVRRRNQQGLRTEQKWGQRVTGARLPSHVTQEPRAAKDSDCGCRACAQGRPGGGAADRSDAQLCSEDLASHSWLILQYLCSYFISMPF